MTLGDGSITVVLNEDEAEAIIALAREPAATVKELPSWIREGAWYGALAIWAELRRHRGST